MNTPGISASAGADVLDRGDTVAPTQSSIFVQVLNAAEQDGVDRHALGRLLWLLNAHPRLLGHRRCLQNLQSLLSTPGFVDVLQGWAGAWTSDIPAWAAAAAWANALAGPALPALEEFTREPRNAHHHVMMRHGINRHPVAGALWIRHHSDPTPSVPTADLAPAGRMFRLLQWHLFCSRAEVRHTHSTLEQYLGYDRPREWPAWPRPAEAAGLALRHFSYARWDELLQDLPFETSLDDFSDALVDECDRLLDAHGDGEARPRIVALTSYFEDYKRHFEGRPGRTRRARAGGRGGARKGIPGFVHFSASPLVLFEPPEPATGDEDVPSRNGTRAHLARDELTPQAIAELEKLGIAPGEDLQPIMDLFPLEERPGGIHSLWIMRQATEAAAQRAYWDRTQLTPLEVRVLLDVIDDVMVERGDPIDQGPCRSAALLLRCMLTLGCTMEDARTMRTMHASDLDSCALGSESLASRVVLVDGHDGSIAGHALAAISPRYVSTSPNIFSVAADAATPYITLPDLAGLGADLLHHQRAEGRDVGSQVFGEPADQLDGSIARLLQAANRRLDPLSRPRLTTTKVSRKLPSVLSRAGLDEVGVAIVCGDRTYEAQARLHYTQHRADELAAAYARALRRMFAEAGRPIAPASPARQPACSAMVGARLVVRREELARFVGALRSEVALMPSPSRSARHRYHQAFLLYTLVMQSLLAGVRPSNRPERILEEMLAHPEPDRELPLVISVVEKDDQYEARARVAAIPHRLKSQLSHLVAHARATWRWQPTNLSTPACSQAQRTFLDWADDAVKPQAQVIDAHWLGRQLATFGLLGAANFTRAYVRTWLLRDGCPEQQIDACLGHANAGQSPTSMHGTFDFMQHLRGLGMRLERMADELGLHPVASHLADAEAGPSSLPQAGA